MTWPPFSMLSFICACSLFLVGGANTAIHTLRVRWLKRRHRLRLSHVLLPDRKIARRFTTRRHFSGGSRRHLLGQNTAALRGNPGVLPFVAFTVAPRTTHAYI